DASKEEMNLQLMDDFLQSGQKIPIDEEILALSQQIVLADWKRKGANEDGPNLKWKQLVVENVKRPFLVVARDISTGEELYYDYGVRPGDFNEGQEMVFLMSGKARKRRRDAAVAMENKKPKEVGDASSGNLKPRTAREIQTQDDSSSKSEVLAIHEREEEKKKGKVGS
ncbi:hypothetical protein QYM36_012818, partial [Artemia franciscana]